ncbi:hypothetical protein niasHS_017560 [Heterodera schachtii]|uniref:Plexin cytoplasmic RasGAP domain-containing protein n=2 Tax=Heterodera TaxID=34509 RepID=A0ABD2I0J8_HETSC
MFCTRVEDQLFGVALLAQFLHCPDLLFDVPPHPASLAGSLAVVGQTLVEAFSRADLDLSSASPSSRLLFARDIARFRPRAEELFRWIAAQPPISAQHFFDYVSAPFQRCPLMA